MKAFHFPVRKGGPTMPNPDRQQKIIRYVALGMVGIMVLSVLGTLVFQFAF